MIRTLLISRRPGTGAIAAMKAAFGSLPVLDCATWSEPSDLFSFLHNHRKEMVVLDTGTTLRNRHSHNINIIKAALEGGTVYYKDEYGYNAFQFTGELIVMTHLPIEEIDEAIKARCLMQTFNEGTTI